MNSDDFQELIESIGHFPPKLLQELMTLQSSSTEFLRQFWSSILTPSANAKPTTPVARATKASRMKEYLEKVESKVEIILHSARQEGVERERVEAVSILNCAHEILTECSQALAPVRQAVAKAIKVYNERTAQM